MENKANNDQQVNDDNTIQSISSLREQSVMKIQKGNPAHLLKAINPNEAQLLDSAANAHVRFRLGGEKFPPNIYYKIYLHGAMCDINSFAPREYSSIKKKIEGDSSLENEGWYLRIDNNGWRPISHKSFNKTDYVEVFTANKIKYFHYKKQKREEKNVRKKRKNKLRWLQKIYMAALKQNESALENLGEQEYIENPFENFKFLDMDDKKFDNEAKELIEWSEQLDFDKYMTDWYVLSTSNASETFISKKGAMSEDIYQDNTSSTIGINTLLQKTNNKVPKFQNQLNSNNKSGQKINENQEFSSSLNDQSNT